MAFAVENVKVRKFSRQMGEEIPKQETEMG